MNEMTAQRFPARSTSIADISGHRKTIADAVKQVVLVIISLGFTNAFTILANPDDVSGGRGPYFFRAECLPTKDCHVFAQEWESVATFAVYLIVGARFLLTSWIYLSATYRVGSSKRLHILSDAVGTFLTAVVIGVQSSYASPNSLLDFFVLFGIVLIIDIASSLISLYFNSPHLEQAERKRERAWLANNIVFVIFAIAVSTLVAPRPLEARSMAAALCTGLVLLNCFVSVWISWRSYFPASQAA